MMEEDMPLRPTGRMERFNIMRNALHMYNTVHVSALYTISISSLPALFGSSPASSAAFQALIFSCLASVVQAHPILGVTIQDEATTTPTYLRLKTIDFTQIVRIIEQDPEACPDSWLQAGLRQRLDRVDELPVWRIIVAVEAASLAAPKGEGLIFRLAFFGHHVIADGVSCGIFHVSFLEALNAYISSPYLPSVSDNKIVPVPKNPLVPSLEENAVLPLTFWYIILVLIKEFIYNPLDTLAWSGAPVSSTIPTAPPPVLLRSFSLPAFQVTALVQKCRQENTTVTGLVLVLVARKLSEMYPEHKHFVAGMPFSMRKFTGHGPRDMGVLVTSCPSYFSFEEKPGRGWISCSTNKSITESKTSSGDEALWVSARKVKEYIRIKTSTPANQAVTMLRFVSDYKPFFLGKVNAARESAFEVTNITTVDSGLSERGERKASFDQVMFCGGLSSYAAPYVISVVSAKGGEMNVCITFEEGVVSENEARSLIKGLKEGLKKCSGAWEM